MSVSIFVAAHKKFVPPRDTMYKPIHVGRELGEELGYTGDHTGDNISRLNPYYSELTALYWIWKNYDEADILGLCHYRRYFLNGKGELMSGQEYTDILSEADIIVAKAVTSDISYYETYEDAHNIKDLIAVGEAVKRVCPEYFDTYERVIHGSSYYVGNLFAAHKKLFKAYARWLFSVFDEAGKHIDVSGYDDYHKRVFGFLSEQMLMVWIEFNKLKVYEADISITTEKAETVEVKKKLEELIREGRFDEASAYLKETAKSRPDIALQDSDMSGELPDIAKIIYICQCEQRAGQVSFLRYANTLAGLVGHYRNIVKILERLKEQKDVPADAAYLYENQVSCISILIIIINHYVNKKEQVYMFNQAALLGEKNKRFESVLPYYEKALEACPDDRETLMNLSRFLDLLGEHELAEEYRGRIK